MRIVSVDVEGMVGKATVFRSESGELVVNIHEPHDASWVFSPGELRGAAVWPIARQLHEVLEGYKGAAGDVADYVSVLNMIAD